MAEGNGSLIRRRILGRQPRQLREDRGLTLEQAAPKLDWSVAKLNRVETGPQSIDVHGVRSMLDLYDAGGEQWTKLIELTRQTADYARALFTSVPISRTPERLANAITVRMLRQKRLTSAEHPLELDAVIDETVLRRPVGGPDVLRAQRHLAEAALLERVTPRILPNDVGAHAGLASGFVILHFGDLGEPDIAYVEHSLGALMLDKADAVTRAQLVWDRVRNGALNPAESLALIKWLASG